MAVQAEWLEKDLYAVLGVAEDADAKAVTRAYRKLARELHPDTHPDDPAAGERFKEVTAAYDVIGDAGKRAEYDDFRRAVAGSGGWPAGGAADGADGRWTRFEPGDADGGGYAWGGFDPSTWTTFDAGDLDGLLGSVLGRVRTTDARRRGADLEAVLDPGFEAPCAGSPPR